MSVVRTMMRHIEPLLMTLGYLDAQVQALNDREETHDETPATIREKMLGYTPATLMSGFIPELTRRIARLNQMTRMQQHQISFDVPGVEVLWQPLTIDPMTRELCVNSSFNDKLIEVNEQIERTFLALNTYKHEHAPSPSPRRRPPAVVRRSSHFDFTAASVSPGGTVSRSSRVVDQVREPVVPVSPEYVPAYADDAASVFMEQEPISPPPSEMEVGSPLPTRHRRSYGVLIHGLLLATEWVEYPIEPILSRVLSHVTYTADCAHQPAPNYKRVIPLGWSAIVQHGSEFVRDADPNPYANVIFGQVGEPCPKGDGWVGLNPMLFTCDAPEELASVPTRGVVEPEIGIWAFDSVDGIINGKRNVIDISQLKRLYNTDRSYGTYRLLFDLIKKDLEANPIQPECQINIVFHVCRTGTPHNLTDITNKFVISDGNDTTFKGRARPLYKYPNGAQIVHVGQVPNYVMEMIGFNVPNQLVSMRPLGSRDVQRGLHFVLQGCFYNLMVYLGITSQNGGEVLTSIQNEGITSRMFLNFVDLMNKQRSVQFLRQFDPVTSPFIVERLPIYPIQQAEIDFNNGISKLLHVMLAISEKFITIMTHGGHPPAHAILVKLLHRRREGEDRVHADELGHWVAFTIDPTDIIQAHAQNAQFVPWRFVDPQGLSIHTEQQPDGSFLSYTVPMSFKRLQTLGISLNEFCTKFSHIDLFYVALPPGQEPQGLQFPPQQITNSIAPRLGGKHRKTKKHCKSKRSKRVKHNKRSNQSNQSKRNKRNNQSKRNKRINR